MKRMSKEEHKKMREILNQKRRFNKQWMTKHAIIDGSYVDPKNLGLSK